jgi:hypothetical protein
MVARRAVPVNEDGGARQVAAALTATILATGLLPPRSSKPGR